MTASKPSLIVKPTSYRIVPFGAGVPSKAVHLAWLHSQLVPRSPLSKIGTSFMRRFYYNVLPRQGHLFGAVAYVGGQAAGFISATHDSDGYMRRAFRDNLFRIAFVAGTSIPTPRRIEGYREAAGLLRGSTPVPAKGTDTAPKGEILSIGVRSSFRSFEFLSTTGIDVYKDLIEGAMDGFREANLEEARIIVDSDDIENQGVYRRLGWRPRQSAVPGWFTPSTEFIWNPR
jgi:ribosomal protein S18 acetylase RimI-like enzyme